MKEITYGSPGEGFSGDQVQPMVMWTTSLHSTKRIVQSGPEFSQRVEAIASAFSSMKNDLDQEKRALSKIWAKREKQIDRVINNISGMYGDMQGIIGASLPQIKSLELTALITEGESGRMRIRKIFHPNL